MPISRQEKVLCSGLWVGGVLYSIYNVFLLRKKFLYITDEYNDFEEGWLVQGINKDISDFEWQSTLYILKKIYPFLITHLILSEYLRISHIKVLPHWQCFISITFILYTTGFTSFLIVLFQPFLFYFILFVKRKYLLWMISGFCLTMILIFKSSTITQNKENYIYFTEEQKYTLMVSLCWTNLRCLSYCLDNIQQTHKLAHFLSYCLYLPTLCLGPFIPFGDFRNNYNCPNHHFLKERTLELFLKLMKCGWWITITELSLHYFYINALSYQLQLLENVDSWTLFGYGYCMGQFFHLKYIVFYGLSTSISKFEHIKTPSLPKCIGRIHLYSDMWKYFDAGLYKFLISYIYLPTLHSTQLPNKLLSSFLSFMFVYIWHGIEYHILIWTVVNYIGICLENIFKEIFKIIPIQCHENWKHRLLCIICSPLLAASAISNFYFFAGAEVGNIFVQRIFQSSILSNIVLLFFLYCCCIVSIEVKKWEEGINVRHKSKLKDR